MKHTLSVLVENKPGVLTRVAGLFARRGFNIDSLVVAQTEDPELSRMTITTEEQDQPVEQVNPQPEFLRLEVDVEGPEPFPDFQDAVAPVQTGGP